MTTVTKPRLVKRLGEDTMAQQFCRNSNALGVRVAVSYTLGSDVTELRLIKGDGRKPDEFEVRATTTLAGNAFERPDELETAALEMLG